MRRKLSADALYAKMKKTMVRKRLFLRKGLTRDEVARELNTNRTYVTRALKGRGLNFAQFVNSYRAQYAIGLMLSKKYAETPLADIAEMSGFSHVETLNRYLKKSAGSTACAFRERILDG